MPKEIVKECGLFIDTLALLVLGIEPTDDYPSHFMEQTPFFALP